MENSLQAQELHQVAASLNPVRPLLGMRAKTRGGTLRSREEGTDGPAHPAPFPAPAWKPGDLGQVTEPSEALGLRVGASSVPSA